jgi:hypothetical protein
MTIMYGLKLREKEGHNKGKTMLKWCRQCGGMNGWKGDKLGVGGC